jgi:DNA-binding NarL/FixJ family response regulator
VQVGRGLSNAKIGATTPFLSEATVKAHVSLLLKEAHLNNRVQIAMLVCDAELQ